MPGNLEPITFIQTTSIKKEGDYDLIDLCLVPVRHHELAIFNSEITLAYFLKQLFKKVQGCKTNREYPSRPTAMPLCANAK